ncbi:metal ABC transporter solute-binding protein, Zn/Mn family, partial [Campylobacter avium]
MKQIALSLLFALSLAFAKPTVTVSIPPQAYFVEQIAKDTVDINILIPEKSDEHNYEIKPQTIKKLEQSDIYFTIGFSFEKIMLEKFQNTLKTLIIVRTQDNIKLLHQEHEAHSHHNHKHEEFDTHIWLDPILVKTQASNIANALVKKYPENKDFYLKNLKDFHKELDELDSDIKAKLSGIKNNKFIVYHPSWSYFAKRYNLVQIPVQINSQEPRAKDLQNLIDLAKKENIKIIFIQDGFSKKAANT